MTTDELNGLGKNYFDQKDYQTAEMLLLKSLAMDAQQAGVLNLLGFIAMQRREGGKAVRYFQTLADLMPGNVDVTYNLGFSKLLAGDLSAEAFAIVDEAAAASESKDSAFVELGRQLAQLGNEEAALGCFRKALENNRDCSDAYYAISALQQPGINYYEMLKRMHMYLEPALYLEIGVALGRSLALALPPTVAVGVDPEPRLEQQPVVEAHICALTSDDFFAQGAPFSMTSLSTVDMAFIDGLHVFEQAFKDFINTERHCRGESVIFIHDCMPIDEVSARRERETNVWSGDVWRLIPVLKKYRPDLALATIAAQPTGLGVVTNLDPDSTVLADNYDAIVQEFSQMPYAEVEADKRGVLSAIDSELETVCRWLEGHRG